MDIVDIFNRNIYKYEFHVKNLDVLTVNEYKSSFIRGFLGFMLRKILCPLRNNSCDECEIRFNCQYFCFFENFYLIEKNGVKIIRNTYRPYIIYSDDDRISIPSDEVFKFEITLIGDSANKKLPYLIAAFKEGGILYGWGKNRVKFLLDKVVNKSNNQNIISNSMLKFPNKGMLITKNNKDLEYLKVNFATPIVLKSKFRSEKHLDPNFLVHSIVKRAYLLCKHFINSNLLTYKDYERMKLYYQGLLNEVKVEKVSLSKKVIWRYSNRKRKKMYFEGLVGDIEIKGKIKKEIFDVLKLGELIHVGKNCSFGFGKILVEV